MIYFHNPGEIDPRLITTLGVNVKESDSPVGFFGTGLKYAIAVLLREQQSITIHSGERRFDFRTVKDTIRGKEFHFIHMIEGTEITPLGFTTELGKNWNLSNAYRELYCNAKDEGGEVTEIAPHPTSGTTVITIAGQDFEQVHLTRDEFLLNPKLTALPCSSPEVHAFSIPSSQIFYRGIAARKLEKTSILHYNLISAHDLTEDRTLKYSFFVDSAIGKFITSELSDPIALHTILTTDCFEHHLDLSSWDCIWSQTFTEAVQQAIQQDPMKLDKRVVAKFLRDKHKDSKNLYTELSLTPAQQQKLDEAVAFLLACGFPLAIFKIIPTEYLGENILGLADRSVKAIRVSALAFEHPDELTLTLLEEFIHLHYYVDDETRAMQNVLFKELYRVGKLLVRCQKKFGISLNEEIPF